MAVSSDDLRGEPFTVLTPLFTLQMKRFFPIIETLIHMCIIHLQTQAISAVITYLEARDAILKDWVDFVNARAARVHLWSPGAFPSAMLKK